MKTAVFTIASKNYFAYVRTIMQSLEKTNPHMDRYAVVVDELDDEFVSLPRNFELLPLVDLDLPKAECFKFRYDIMEFNTAVKPFSILKLFEKYDRVIYLDPDIYVYKKLTPIEEPLDNGYNFVLTPHFNHLFEDDGLHADESDIMKSGIYNLGFIALNKCEDTLEMVRWWADRLEYRCINAQEEGIFVDQKWIDLVPGYYSNVYILRHSGVNVAYWNLSHRTVKKSDGEFYVNGEPLIFFHFSGFNPNKIEDVSKHQNRFTISRVGDAAELFEKYAQVVLSNDFDMWKKFKYSYDKYSDGRAVLREHRYKYRNDKQLQGYCGDNPYGYSRLFYGEDEMSLAHGGVNLVGYLRSEHGVGEAVRCTARALEASNVEWIGYDFEDGNPNRKEDKSFKDKLQQYIKNDISILNVNADQFPALKANMPKELWDTYKIGVWYWELPEFPTKWMRAFMDVNEIWAPTKFIADCLKKCAPCPVYHMPPGISLKEIDIDKYTREYYGLPKDRFLFLNMFDVYSFSGRKNPEAVVASFKKAFACDDDSVGLVLKLNNSRFADTDMLKNLVGDYKNIYIIAKTMTKDEVNGLINVCDASVSLHRSEGLGLLCEESMFYGKPVIATGWSGNMDFMTKEESCLVDYDIVNIGKDIGPYEAWQQWAEPKVDDAADYMRRLATDKEYYEKKANLSKQYIRSEFSSQKCGERMKKRLEEIKSQFTKAPVISNKDKSTIMAYVCMDSYRALLKEHIDSVKQKKLINSWLSGDVLNIEKIASDMNKTSFVQESDFRTFVIGMYEKILRRTPSENEVAMWSDSGTDRTQLIMNFLFSAEFLQDYAEVYNLEKKNNDVKQDKHKSSIDKNIEEKDVNERILFCKKNLQNNDSERTEMTDLFTALEEQRSKINSAYDVSFYQPLNGNFLSVFIKRVIRKITAFLLKPLVEQQTMFNAYVTQYINLQKKANDHIYADIQFKKDSDIEVTQEVIELIEKKNKEIVERLIEEIIASTNDNQQKSLDRLAELLTEKIDLSKADYEQKMDERFAALSADNKAIIKSAEEVQDKINWNINSLCQRNADHIIEVDGSRHNLVVNLLNQIIDDTKREKTDQLNTDLVKAAIKDKWATIDSIEAQNEKNHNVTCCICGSTFESDSLEQIVSDCIFNGGRLKRYKCPSCGVIFGPEKMLNLPDRLFDEDYKIHYSVYNEGDSTQQEIDLFMKLNPDKSETYLDYGVGAWSSVIPTLREKGYNVYGYDPYAPVHSEYIISSPEELKKLKFDAIISHDLLEHLRNPLQEFKMYNDILKDNGRMIHSTACFDYVYEYSRFHLFFYTGDAVKIICEKTGFEVVNVYKDSVNLIIEYTFKKIRK